MSVSIALPATAAPARSRSLALGLLATAQFMVVVDSAVVNVAIPSIQRGLQFSAVNIQWVFNAYLLTYGGLLLLGGRTADVLGRRRMFMAGAGLMTLASLFAGLSTNQGELIAARALQGLGAAVITPAALSIILQLFTEPAERNKALGIWGALAGMGAATGVLLGGVITQGPGWRWIFFINVPVAAAVTLLSRPLLPESRTATGTFDFAGGIAITAGIVLAVYAVVKAPDNGWGSAQTIALVIGGLALIAGFVAIELRTRQPLLRLGILRNGTVAGANAASFLITGAFFAALFLLTLYMQQSLGYSAIKTGVAYLPLALGVVASSVFASRVVTLCGVKFMLLMSTPIVGVGLFLLSRVSSTSSYAGTLLPAFLVTAFGIGVAMVSLSIAAFAGIGDHDFGVASGLYNTSSQIGGAVGVAILSTVAYSHIRSHPGVPTRGLLAEAYSRGFGSGIAFVGAAFVIVALAVRHGEVRTWTCATPYRSRVIHRRLTGGT